jgi:hypothetical protein
MSIIVTSVSLTDFKSIAKIDSFSVGIFEAAWMSHEKTLETRHIIFQSLISLDIGLSVLYSIKVNGNDDTEDFVVDEMLVNNLPSLAIFSRGCSLQYKTDIDKNSSFNTESFKMVLSRVITESSYPNSNTNCNSNSNPNSNPNSNRNSNPNSNLKNRVITESSLTSNENHFLSPQLNSCLTYGDTTDKDTDNISSCNLSLEAIVSHIFHSDETKDDHSNKTSNCNISNTNHKNDKSSTGDLVNKNQSASSKSTTNKPETLKLFLSGDKSSVGKSSTCLAILASLIQLGVDPNLIAYIKVFKTV